MGRIQIKQNKIKIILIVVVAVLCIILGVLGFMEIRKAYIRYIVRSSAYGENYDTLTDAVKNGLPGVTEGQSGNSFGSIYEYDPSNPQEETEAEEETEQDFVVCNYVTNMLDQIGYVYKDVNGDGVKDFLIGINVEDAEYTQIYDVYTLDSKGKPVHAFSGSDYKYLMITKDGDFVASYSQIYEDYAEAETEVSTEAESSEETETASAKKNSKTKNETAAETGTASAKKSSKAETETAAETEAASAKKSSKTDNETAAETNASAGSEADGSTSVLTLTQDGLKTKTVSETPAVRVLHLYAFE